MGAVVLATNDDGIEAPGLRALVAGLARAGFRVYVSAPRRPSSSMGKALRYPARYGRIPFEGAVSAWWVDSTPAAAVVAALRYFLDEPPRVVVSGINRGPNMGVEDLLTSGTIGAAIEASLHGIPSIAVSLATDEGWDIGDYSEAARLAAALARAVVENPPPPGGPRLLVVNVPEGRPRGVRLTRLAWNDYRIPLREREQGILEPVPHSYRERYWDRGPGTDVEAVLNGYASVTPVCLAALQQPRGLEWARSLVGRVEEILGAPRR